MALVKFIKNSYAIYLAGKSDYDTDGSIFFCTDKPLIITGGVEYGVSQEIIEANLDGVKSVLKTGDDTNSVTITISYFKESTPDTVITLSTATSSKAGLMSKEDKTNLDKVVSAVFGNSEGEGETIDDRIEDAIADVVGEAEELTDLGKVEDAINAMDLTKTTGDLVTWVAQEDGVVTAGSTTVGNGLELDDALAVKIAAANKVLAATADGITATLNFVDNTATSKIELQGIGGVKVAEFDYAKFIVDGMLDDAEINESNELVLTMNTAAGSKELKVDLTKYIDVYTAGNGITVSGKVISAKAKEGDKYVEVTADGIASKGIDTAISTAVGNAKSELESKIEELEEFVGKDDNEAKTVDEQITEAIEGLDVTNIGGTGKYIQVVGQTDGKVTATAQDLNATAVAITAIEGLTTSSNNVQAALKALVDMWEWHEA